MHAPSSERPVLHKLPRESKSSIGRERSRHSRGGERHTRQGDQRCTRALNSERPVPLKPPKESKSSFDRERSRRSCGGEHHTRQGDQRDTRRAARGLCRSSFRERARAASIESVADTAAAASVTPDRAISGARAEQRAACAAQASEGESSSIYRERSRRFCGSERHTHWAINVARAEQRAACAAQASEREREQH